MKRIVAALLLALVAGCAVPEESGTTDTTAKSGTISKGAGTKDASADVKLVSFKEVDKGYGMVSFIGTLEVTNHSEKPSDYYIEITIENKAGENIDWTNAVVEHLRPGQKAKAGFEVFNEGAHKAVIHEIQRTESL